MSIVRFFHSSLYMFRFYISITATSIYAYATHMPRWLYNEKCDVFQKV